jgi:predicted RNase H-like HicB family nuclease
VVVREASRNERKGGSGFGTAVAMGGYVEPVDQVAPGVTDLVAYPHGARSLSPGIQVCEVAFPALESNRPGRQERYHIDKTAASDIFEETEVHMAKQFTVVIERDEEGYYVADVPELKGCHTQARSLDELLERVKESIQLCLEVYGEGVPTLEFVGIQKVAV